MYCLYQWLLFHTFSIKHYNTVILSENTKGFLHLYALKHCCFCSSTVFISLYLSSLQKFHMLDLKCNYNQFHRILGQFSLNIGIYYPFSFSYHFFLALLKLSLWPSMTFFNFSLYYFCYDIPYIFLYKLKQLLLHKRQFTWKKINKPNWLFKAKIKKSQTTKHQPKTQHSWEELYTKSQKEHITL